MVSFSLPALGRIVALVSLTSGVLPATAAPSPASASMGETKTTSGRAGVPCVARQGLSPAQFQETFDSWKSQGYRLTSLAGYALNDDARYAGVWEQSVPYEWAARYGLSSSQYQQAYDTYIAQGYRPTQVYGYNVAGTPLFAAIFDKSPAPGNGAWVARHGLTAMQYEQEYEKLVGQGFRLAHVSGYAEGGEARYAVIWEQPADSYAWMARHGLTSAQYQTAFDQFAKEGYRLVKVSGYVVGGIDYYAAIWDKAPSPGWVSRHGLTSAEYQSEADNWVGQGYRPSVLSAYTLGGNQDRYAAIFVKDQAM